MEGDSSPVISWGNGEIGEPRELLHSISEPRDLFLQVKALFSHVHGEHNSVRDALAKWGERQSAIFNNNEFPRSLSL